MLAVGVLIFAVGASPSAGATRPDRTEAKLHPDVAALAAAAQSSSAQLNVIVLGNDVAAASAKAGARTRHRLTTIRGESVRVPVDRLDELAAHPGVSFVAPDIPVAPTLSPLPISFPLLTTQYPKIVGAPAAWNAGVSGDGVGIAVIDSGIASVSDFGTRLVPVQVAGLPAPADTYGHGSFVAAIAAGSSADGRYVGVAPRAKVFAINVAQTTGGTVTSDIIAGLDWVLANAAQHNIRVVNLSLSETVESSYLSNLLDTAVERVWRAGIVVVVSAGNRGAGAASYAPANDPFVITVGATDSVGTLSLSDDVVTSWSSSGTTRDGIKKPELHAPGRLIPSVLPTASTLAAQAPLTNLLGGGYGTMSGSSFSAPQVSGAAALLLELHPTWTPDQVKQVLLSSSASMSGSARVLSISAAIAVSGTPAAANQGLTPTFYGLDGASTTADPTSGTWNSGTWNSGTWNSGTWNSGTWNFSTWD